MLESSIASSPCPIQAQLKVGGLRTRAMPYHYDTSSLWIFPYILNQTFYIIIIIMAWLYTSYYSTYV